MLLNWINGVFGKNGYLIFPGNYLSSEVKHNGVIAAAQARKMRDVLNTNHVKLCACCKLNY